jgi:hypothetical protein
MRFATANIPTPILNSPNFPFHGTRLPIDEQGLLRCIETIALPGTKFQIISEPSPTVYQVTTCDYPGDQLFVDRRFLSPATQKTPERRSRLPSVQKIVDHLLSLEGATYIWGGNWSTGIPEMLQFYPPEEPLDPMTHLIWTLKGVDCSGLLYEATDGFTPRNTPQLIDFGTTISVPEKPLDLIVWKGHVIIALDSHRAIESKGGVGVIQSDLQRIKRLLEFKKTPFLVKRWHPDLL